MVSKLRIIWKQTVAVAAVKLQRRAKSAQRVVGTSTAPAVMKNDSKSVGGVARSMTPSTTRGVRRPPKDPWFDIEVTFAEEGPLGLVFTSERETGNARIYNVGKS